MMEPSGRLIPSEYVPTSPSCTDAKCRVELVLPGIATPCFAHWNTSGSLLWTEATRVAGPPTVATTVRGTEAVTGLPIVSSASTLVTEPKLLVTMTEYRPAWELWTFESARVLVVAPATGFPSLRH